jgi:RNA polymerase sigma-70 factor, ECF subfamily
MEDPLTRSSESREARFNRFHAEHFEAIRRYAFRRDPETADDVVAETFAIAWRRLETVPREPRPWLVGVARNVRLNALRSQRRQDALARRLADLPVESTSAEALDASFISGEILEALGGLSPVDREVLLLHAWEGLDRSQIAEALRISKANVSVRLYRARVRFQRALGEELTSNKLHRTPVVIPGGTSDGH